jgi:hypothetical protein
MRRRAGPAGPACERLMRASSEHKVRIKDLVRQLLPMTPLTRDLCKADLTMPEHYADPRVLVVVTPPAATRHGATTASLPTGGSTMRSHCGCMIITANTSGKPGKLRPQPASPGGGV